MAVKLLCSFHRLYFLVADILIAKDKQFHYLLFSFFHYLLFSTISFFLFSCLSGFPDPGWKVFYDSATPHAEKMPDPWDAVSGLDRCVLSICASSVYNCKDHYTGTISVSLGCQNFCLFAGWSFCGVLDRIRWFLRSRYEKKLSTHLHCL